MNKTFKKIAASIMAVTTLAVSMAGMSANAYGGYNYETFNNVSIEKYIDCAKYGAGGHTKCTSQACSYVYVSINATNSSTGSKSDSFFATRGTASVHIEPDSGKTFKTGTTSHYVVISGVSKWLDQMVANAG